MSKRNLKAVKKEAYVWRVHSWGMGENFNYIPCWYVVDTDTDEIVAGGYNSGSNYRSGRAYIPRRKDAKAFIDGYMSEEGTTNPHGEMVSSVERFGAYGMPRIDRKLKGADDQTEAFWDDGNTSKLEGTFKKFSELK